MLVTPHITFKGKTYFFKKSLGLLLCSEDNGSDCVDCQHTDDYSFVANPYLLEKRQVTACTEVPGVGVKFYSRLLLFVCRYCYPLIFFIPKVVRPVYDNAGLANAVFYRLFPAEQQRQLCLPRALFTASLSKRFRTHGTLFIGAFLPTNRLHAWVIEDGMHADVYDNQWIQYTPVMEWQWKKK